MGIVKTYSRGGRFTIKCPSALVLTVIVVVLLGDLLRGLAVGQTQFADTGTFVWDGLMRGLVIGLADIGSSTTCSILNFANFSRGDYITAGAFSGRATAYLIAGLGCTGIGALLLVGTRGSVYGGTLGVGMLSTPLAVVAGIVVSGGFVIALSLAVDCTIFKPVRDEDGITLLITSVGVAFALRCLIQSVFSSDVRGTTIQPPSLPLNFIDGTVFINVHDITLLMVVSALILGVRVLLRRTKLGEAIHAMADNKDLTLITGISTERVVHATQIIGGGLTGVAGYIFILRKGTLGFDNGWLLLLLIFAAVTLGGIGSIYGAIAGDLIIGLMALMSVLWIPSVFLRAVAFVVMIIILLVKLSGLFSGRATA